MHDVPVAVRGGHPAVASRPASAFARCGRCGAHFDEPAWQSLELLHRVTTDEVRALVTVWPASASIDVRACTKCRGAIARKRA